MSMKFIELYGPGDVIPPRPAKPQPPEREEIAAQVAAAQAALRDAEAAEAALMDERQALKAQPQGLEQNRQALSQQRLPPRRLDWRAAELLDRRQELEEEDCALTQRQHSARLRAGRAVEALKQAPRRLERAQRRQAQEA
jgi:hypothetical protein